MLKLARIGAAAIAITAITATAFYIEPTLAQVVAPAPAPVPPPATFSWGDLAGQILLWLAVAFAAVTGAIITNWVLKLMKLAGVQVNAAMRDQLKATVVNGLNAGAAAAAERLKGQGTVAIKSAAVADAIKYAQAHAGETIKALGLDPQSGEAVQAIKAIAETAITDPTVPTNPALGGAPKVGDVPVAGEFAKK